MAQPVTPECAASFVRGIPDMTEDIEGFVCQAINSDGLPIWFKVKTKKYCALHHCKDSISNPRRLFEVILSEGIDDVKSMFWDDPVVMGEIERMEAKTEALYNRMVAEVERFYESNKALDRKDYAIKAKAEVTPLYFSLAMNRYLGKAEDYKAFLVNRWKDLEKSLTD
jgi:T4 RnlA family RNA ligase